MNAQGDMNAYPSKFSMSIALNLPSKMTYIDDCDEVSGILDERYHGRVVKDCVWDIQANGKERECGFRSAGISSESYIVVDCSLTIGRPIFRFQYDGLRIVVKVGNKPFDGRKILSDHADSSLKKSA